MHPTSTVHPLRKNFFPARNPAARRSVRAIPIQHFGFWRERNLLGTKELTIESNVAHYVTVTGARIPGLTSTTGIRSRLRKIVQAARSVKTPRSKPGGAASSGIFY